MKTILVLFVIFGTFSLGFCDECPEGFVNLGSRCYYFSKETASWLEASRKCTEMEASLLAIQTSSEAQLIFDQAVKLNEVSNVRKPSFVWTSTWEPFTYTAWCNGEPNNWENDEYCVHLTTLQKHNTRACWNDRGCVHSTTHGKDPMHYICETDEIESSIFGSCPVCTDCEECGKCAECPKCATCAGGSKDEEEDKLAYEITIHEI